MISLWYPHYKDRFPSLFGAHKMSCNSGEEAIAIDLLAKLAPKDHEEATGRKNEGISMGRGQQSNLRYYIVFFFRKNLKTYVCCFFRQKLII